MPLPAADKDRARYRSDCGPGLGKRGAQEKDNAAEASIQLLSFPPHE